MLKYLDLSFNNLEGSWRGEKRESKRDSESFPQGASRVGIGNIEEIGPLDTDLKPRKSTWLKKADLLFVDNPVGTGYSFVEDTEMFVRTDDEAATDAGKSHLYIVAESYGGKFAVTAGLSILKAIDAGKLKLKLGGVALGNIWISPEDFVFAGDLFLRMFPG